MRCSIEHFYQEYFQVKLQDQGRLGEMGLQDKTNRYRGVWDVWRKETKRAGIASLWRGERFVLDELID